MFVTPEALLITDPTMWVLRVPRSAVLDVDLQPGTITRSTRLRVRVPLSFLRGSPWSNLIDLDASAAVLQPLFDDWVRDGVVRHAPVAATPPT